MDFLPTLLKSTKTPHTIPLYLTPRNYNAHNPSKLKSIKFHSLPPLSRPSPLCLPNYPASIRIYGTNKHASSPSRSIHHLHPLPFPNSLLTSSNNLLILQHLHPLHFPHSCLHHRYVRYRWNEGKTRGERALWDGYREEGNGERKG